MRYREWVRRDLTGDGWVRRHFTRTLVQWAPSLLLLLLPGPWLLRASLPLLVLIGALYISASYLQETRVHRLHRHGLPAELAEQADEVRRDAKELADLVRIERRRAAMRTRYSEGTGRAVPPARQPPPGPRRDQAGS